MHFTIIIINTVIDVITIITVINIITVITIITVAMVIAITTIITTIVTIIDTIITVIITITIITVNGPGGGWAGLAGQLCPGGLEGCVLPPPCVVPCPSHNAGLPLQNAIQQILPYKNAVYWYAPHILDAIQH